ncbi:MAG: hypothetical protein ACE5FI_10385 [Anaerolineales bacterium]
MATNATNPARRGLNFSIVQLVVVLGLILGISIILDLRQRIQAAQTIIAESQRLETDVQALHDENRGLQATLAYVESNAYVEDWAHSEGQLVRPGEVLVIPVSDGEAIATPEPAEPPPPTVIEQWQLWWQLFFDAEQ